MGLNAFQQQVSNLAKSLGLKGSREAEVYGRPEFQQLLTRLYGALPLPAGISESQIIFRDGQTLEYRDNEGYVHRLERDLQGGSPTLGSIRETSTNRPAILPSSTQQQQTDLSSQLLNQLAEQFAQPIQTPDIQNIMDRILGLTTQLQLPPGLQALDPQTQAMLDTINAAQNAQLQQQFDTAQGKLIAQLFGQGVNQSSIGNQAAGQLLQQQGLVQQQANADAAARQLGLQQFLSDLFRQNQQTALSGLLQGGGLALNEFATGQQARSQTLEEMIQGLNNLMGIQTQRDIASSGLGLDFQKFLENQRQFNVGSYLNAEQLRAQERIANANKPSLFDNILKGVGAAVSIGAAPFTGGASLFGLAGSLFGGGGSGAITGAGSMWPQN